VIDVLILDNYDSFTWNLVQAAESLGGRCQVVRSDCIGLDEVAARKPDRIILSPGPYGPERTGICPTVVRELSGRVPILGVCLGMQVIARAAGAVIRASGRPVHGKADLVFHGAQGILRGIPSPFPAARYHSLQVDPETIPSSLEVTAQTAEGIIMGCRLKDAPTEGLLFHPESFLTEAGPAILRNFLHVG
jgi:anthranilate synthase component II